MLFASCLVEQKMWATFEPCTAFAPQFEQRIAGVWWISVGNTVWSLVCSSFYVFDFITTFKVTNFLFLNILLLPSLHRCAPSTVPQRKWISSSPMRPRVQRSWGLTHWKRWSPNWRSHVVSWCWWKQEVPWMHSSTNWWVRETKVAYVWNKVKSTKIVRAD